MPLNVGKDKRAIAEADISSFSTSHDGSEAKFFKPWQGQQQLYR